MRWLPYLNVVLAGTLALTLALFFFLMPSSEGAPVFSPSVERSELPVSAFAQGDWDVDEGPLTLNWVAPQMQLPDLSNELLFYGQNNRPDAVNGSATYYITLKSSSENLSVRPDERIYLVYQGNYRFSPGNQPTGMWLEFTPQWGGALTASLSMLDEKGVLVTAPQERHSFTVAAQQYPAIHSSGWEMGGLRVDSTLLVRQKAHWVGPDRFLEVHGGEEFAHTVGKERIDFMNTEPPYGCFVGENDYLVWKDNRWWMPMKGEDTAGLPLLHVKSINEKIMSLELWDAEGRGCANMTLIKANDRQQTPNINEEFKFVGAKTWAQFIVECRNTGRLTLKPNDWLILTQNGWEKIDTPEQIDAYVEKEQLGPLFVLDKMEKQNGHQVLVGHIFNVSRTKMEEIALEASTNNSLSNFCRTIPITPPIKPEIAGDAE